METDFVEMTIDHASVEVAGASRDDLADRKAVAGEAELPLEGARSADPFHRTMIAQDTGSAIVGPARADLYFGAGDDAGRVAGRIRQPGRFAMLVPREIDPVAAGARVPLPQVRPAPEPEKPAKALRRSGLKALRTPSRHVRRHRAYR